MSVESELGGCLRARRVRGGWVSDIRMHGGSVGRVGV